MSAITTPFTAEEITPSTPNALPPRDKKKSLGKNKERIFIGLMLLWPLLHFAVFWVYTNAATFYLTLFRENVAQNTWEWCGLDRFKDILDSIFVNPNAQIVNYVKNSLLVFPIENFIMLPLSFVFAFFMAKKVPLTGFFRIIFFLPSILSIVVLTMAYKFMFDHEFGPITALVESICGERIGFFNTEEPIAMRMVFLFTIWSGLGYKMMVLQGAIERIPQELIEAGKVDGMSLATEFFQITLPFVMPNLTTFVVLNTCAVFTYYLHPFLIIGDSGGFEGSTGTVALEVFRLTNAREYENAAAFGLLFSIVGIPFILSVKWGMEKLTPDVEL